MKRSLLFCILSVCTMLTHAQIKETFTPNPANWILSQGAGFTKISGNDVVVTSGVGGNTPAVIGTPAVSKTSNTVKICMDVWAYTSNLNNQVPFACATYADVLFVKSTVTTANDAQSAANIYARLDNYELPLNGGNTCINFTFPAVVTAADFKVFISFHSGCNQGGVRYVMDNFQLSGVDDVCAGTSCAPGTSDDVFNRINPAELSFNAVLYGSNLNYPAPASGYAIDATGTDNDQNDTYAHVRWQLLTAPANGSVTINPDGTCTITRSSTAVTKLTFTYRLCDDGADDNFATAADNLCTDAAVTVNFPAPSTLPVSILNFTAVRNGSIVTLKWTTSFESNNKGFELQRSSNNKPYQVVAFLPTQARDGFSQVPVTYEYKEMNATEAVSYYKLMQLDKDGVRKIYTIKVVQGQTGKSALLLYPNPSVNGNLTVVFDNNNEREIMLNDLSGKTVKQWKRYAGDNLAIDGLHAGMYLLQVTNLVTNEKVIEKIMVVKQ